MKKIKLLFLSGFLLNIIGTCFAQSEDEAAIRSLLTEQTTSWNNGKMEKFMQGYWQNDSLMFIGKSGITYGWQKTLENYKRGYPDTAYMGKLNLTLLEVKKLSALYYFVAGKWHLARNIGELSGYFTLLFKKIKGQWVIVTDHSS